MQQQGRRRAGHFAIRWAKRLERHAGWLEKRPVIDPRRRTRSPAAALPSPHESAALHNADRKARHLRPLDGNCDKDVPSLAERQDWSEKYRMHDGRRGNSGVHRCVLVRAGDLERRTLEGADHCNRLRLPAKYRRLFRECARRPRKNLIPCFPARPPQCADSLGCRL